MIYVILAHHSPGLLRQLLKALQHKENYFVIHIDMNYEIFPFIEAADGIENCHFTPTRYASVWGSFGIVEATLHAFDYIRKTLRKRQRIILLSGSDYPIKTNEYIFKYLNANRDTVFLEHFAIPRDIWHAGGINRFPVYAKVSKQINLYGGSQWFSIPSKALTILFRFLKENPNFLEYFRYVKIPDESFFQTLFLNCDSRYIKMNLRNLNLHHIKWDKPYIHPRILTLRDLPQIQKSKNLFARKFDLFNSKELVNKLGFDKSKKSEHSQPKVAVIFLTDKSDNVVKNKYEKLKKEAKGMEVFKIVTRKEYVESTEDNILYEHHYCKELGYIPFDNKNIIPGCTYFALLYFFLNHSAYDHYWLIEDDVWYNGDWKHFFKKHRGNDVDFIGAYHTSYQDAPHWHWWNSLTTRPVVPLVDRKRTFYRICRFSTRALEYLDIRLKKGDHGHGEVLIPTLFYLRGFSFSDLANVNEQSVVLPSTDGAIGNHNNGSFRYRPIINIDEIKGEYLFHPVKEDIKSIL